MNNTGITHINYPTAQNWQHNNPNQKNRGFSKLNSIQSIRQSKIAAIRKKLLHSNWYFLLFNPSSQYKFWESDLN